MYPSGLSKDASCSSVVSSMPNLDDQAAVFPERWLTTTQARATSLPWGAPQVISPMRATRSSIETFRHERVTVGPTL
jgi:hypothetical protein